MYKKAFCWLVNGLSVLLIAASLLVLLSTVLTRGDAAPDILGYSAFRIVSGSMEPAYTPGEMIVVRRVAPEEVAVGDVITFYSQDPQLRGAVNTHRVTQVDTQGGQTLFTTRGDANPTQDEYPARGQDIIGKVVFSSQALGMVSRLAANPLIFAVLIVAPLLWLLLSNLIRTVRLAREALRREEEEAVAEALRQLKGSRPPQETAPCGEKNAANE